MSEKTKCDPVIWRKFTLEQKRWWLKFYDSFSEPTNYPTGFDGEDNKSQELRRVIAHNMATLAIWEMNGLVSKE